MSETKMIQISDILSDVENYNDMEMEDYVRAKMGIERNNKVGKRLWEGKIILLKIDNPVYQYKCIDGNHRLKILASLNIREIPEELCDIKENLTEEEIFDLKEQMNTRGHRNPIKYAMALEKLQKSLGISQKELANRKGLKEPYVSRILKRLELSKDVKEKVVSSQLSGGAVDAIMDLPEKEWKEAFDWATSQKVTVKKAREYVSNFRGSSNNPDSAPQARPLTPEEKSSIEYENAKANEEGTEATSDFGVIIENLPSETKGAFLRFRRDHTGAERSETDDEFLAREFVKHSVKLGEIRMRNETFTLLNDLCHQLGITNERFVEKWLEYTIRTSDTPVYKMLLADLKKTMGQTAL